MKKISVFIFSVLFLLMSMQQVTFYLLFKLNQDSITRQYCINKNKPASCCKGKCHLMKTIAESEKQNDSNPFSVLTFKAKNIDLFFTDIDMPEERILNQEIIHTYKNIQLLLFGYLEGLIKPPIALS